MQEKEEKALPRTTQQAQMVAGKIRETVNA
jgi:hypothetical protein